MILTGKRHTLRNDPMQKIDGIDRRNLWQNGLFSSDLRGLNRGSLRKGEPLRIVPTILVCYVNIHSLIVESTLPE